MPKIKSDGNPGYQLQQTKAEIENHNSEIKGEFGLTGLATVVLQKRKKGNANLILKFTYPVNREGLQKSAQYSLGGFGSAYSHISRKKIYEASRRITQALKFNQFSRNPIDFWDWLDYDVLGKPKPGNEVFNIGDLVDSYKAYWIKSNNDKKHPEERYHKLRGQYLDKLPRDKDLSGKIIEDYLISLLDNYSLRLAITTIKDWLSYHRLFDTYQANVNCRKCTGKDAKEKSTYTPNDEQIIRVYEQGFLLVMRDGRRKPERLIKATQAYQFIYGIMATYGIRAHEFFHVMNWHDPVDISCSEWLQVDAESNDASNDEYGSSTVQFDTNRVIPAFFDPANEHPFLVIGDDTKTGKRLAVPLSPKSDNWVERFHLKDGLKLPDIKNPTNIYNCGNSKGSLGVVRRLGASQRSAIRWDLTDVPPFSSHKLRHAYTHRGRCLGFNPWKLAQSQGHTLTTAENVYAKNLQGQRNKEMLTEELERIESQSTPKLTYDEAILRVSHIIEVSDSKHDTAMNVINAIYGMSKGSQLSTRN